MPATIESRNTVVLRLLRAADFDAVDELLAATWRATYGQLLSDLRMRVLLRLAQTGWRHDSGPAEPITIVAEQAGQIAGMISYAHDLFAQRVFIAMLYVHPSTQGQGIGSALLDRVAEVTSPRRGLRICVLEGNDKAVEFYRGHGFKIAKRKWDLWTFSRIIVMDRPAADDSAAGSH